MISNRHILVLTLSFGSGHVRAAHATAQALRHQSPDADVRVVDALEKCRRLFRAFYVWPYWLTVRYWPALWGHYFASRVNRKSQGTAPEWAFRWGCPKAFEMIASFEPDTIIAAEVGACEIAVIAKRTGLTKARIINLVTDYQAEPAWVKAEVDAFAVADQGVREQLIRWGAPARKIVACGIPTDPTFARKHDLKAHRPRFGLSDDHVPLVLVMGGGMGPTRMDRVVDKLCTSGTPMQIIAIAGHDTRARQRLERLHAAPPVSLRVLGWTNDVAELMQAASLLVTKAGGLTIAEAALCGLPIVTFDVIPGPEQQNATQLAEAGAAVLTTSVEEAANAVLSLLRDGTRRRTMCRRIKELAHCDAAREVALLALEEENWAREMAVRKSI
jgi:processive 1,2-diacylglycerol beta-glucosyltransferase